MEFCRLQIYTNFTNGHRMLLSSPNIFSWAKWNWDYQFAKPPPRPLSALALKCASPWAHPGQLLGIYHACNMRCYLVQFAGRKFNAEKSGEDCRIWLRLFVSVLNAAGGYADSGWGIETVLWAFHPFHCVFPYICQLHKTSAFNFIANQFGFAGVCEKYSQIDSTIRKKRWKTFCRISMYIQRRYVNEKYAVICLSGWDCMAKFLPFFSAASSPADLCIFLDHFYCLFVCFASFRFVSSGQQHKKFSPSQTPADWWWIARADRVDYRMRG